MKSDVNIGNFSGNRLKDEAQANLKAGLKETPEGYTWHHHQKNGRMQLVKADIHKKTGHTGGHAIHKTKQ